LVAGGALLLAALLLVRPFIVPLLVSLITPAQMIVFAVLGVAAHFLTQLTLPPALLPMLMACIVIAAWLSSPTNPATPYLAVLVVLVGALSGSQGQQIVSPLLLLPALGAAFLLSHGALRARRTQQAYAAARLSLEREIQQLQDERSRIIEPSKDATAVLAAAGKFACALEPDEILQQIVRGTAEQVGAVGSLLLVWDDTQQTLRVAAISEPGTSATADLRNMEVDPDGVPTLRDHPPGQVVPLEPSSFRAGLVTSLLQRWKVKNIVGIRLERADLLLGLLFVCRATAGAPFTKRDHGVLSGIALHAVAALAHANLISDLRNAYQLKEEFMATMSHELRTPLNVIIGYTDLQIEGVFGDLNEEHLDAVQRTREQALQLLELIQATLDMSRLERGLMNVELREVSISHFLEVLQSQIPSSWRKPTVELNWQTVPGLPTLRTDPNKLQIILRNLIHNALKFTNHGLVSVTVSSRPARDEVTFVVQDSGIGIRAEHLSQVFEMFRQIPQPDCVPGGVGLGLYIVRRFAYVIGAEIEVSSAPGRGTTFRVHVPVAGPLAALQRRKKNES